MWERRRDKPTVRQVTSHTSSACEEMSPAEIVFIPGWSKAAFPVDEVHTESPPISHHQVDLKYLMRPMKVPHCPSRGTVPVSCSFIEKWVTGLSPCAGCCVPRLRHAEQSDESSMVHADSDQRIVLKGTLLMRASISTQALASIPLMRDATEGSLEISSRTFSWEAGIFCFAT